MRALLLVLLAWSTEAGFRMEGYDSGEPGSGPCESHTLSWADAHWTNLQNPHESVDDVACLNIYEDEIPVSMRIDASACSAWSSESKIWMTTYDSHGCGHDVDRSTRRLILPMASAASRRRTRGPASSTRTTRSTHGRCWNIFSVRLSCWDGSHPTSDDDDDAPATASTEVLWFRGVLRVGR